MAKKTNKTAHVLNLLTKSPAVQEEGTAEENKAPAEHQAAAPVPPAATVTVVDESGNDRLEKDILQQLEHEVSQAASSEAEPIPAPKPEVSAKKAEVLEEKPKAPEKEPEVLEEKAEIPEPEPEVFTVQAEMPAEKEETPEPEPETAAQPKTPEGKQEIPVSEKASGKAVSFVNVMEELLKRQDIDKYMKQYNVCQCERCRADVEALTLTRLPAKYVAVKSGFGTSAMNYYESKYKIRILTEIIRSCIAVRERPRHD